MCYDIRSRKQEEKMAKFDKVYNIILTIAIIGFVAALVWKLVDAFLL